MKPRISRITDILHMLYGIAVSSLAFAFAEVILIKQNVHAYLPAVTAAMFVASYVLRSCAGRFGWLLLGHGVLAAALLALPVSTETKCIYALIPAYLFVSSVRASRGTSVKQADDIPWPSFLLCLIVYLVSSYLQQTGMRIYAYATALFLLVLYLLLLYTDGMKRYLDSAGHVQGVPVRQILSVNTIMVAAIMLVLLVGLALGEVFDFRRLLMLFADAILAVLRVLAMLVGLFWKLVSLWFRSGEEETGEHSDFTESDAPATVRSLGETLEPILYVGLLCLGIFLLYKILVRLVRFLMTKRNITGDRVETIVIRKEKSRQQKKAARKKLFLSDEERARRYYRDCIERYRYDISLEQTKTGREIEAELGSRELADVGELTDCYEQIRYGGVPANRAMLSQMRKLAQR